jgi:hypothetical protein
VSWARICLWLPLWNVGPAQLLRITSFRKRNVEQGNCNALERCSEAVNLCAASDVG